MMSNCTDLIKIQSTASPFRTVPNERLNVTHGRLTPCALSEDEQRVLLIINKTLVCTAALMEQILTKIRPKEELPTTLQIRKLLMKLSNHGYLCRLYFSNDRSTGAYYVFALGPEGRTFVRGLGRQVNRARYVANLNAESCKRLLSSLQFVVSQGMFCSEYCAFGQLVIEDHLSSDRKTDFIFRSNAAIHHGKQITYVESVRNRPEAVDTLLSKLQRMEFTLASYKPLNIDKVFPRSDDTTIVIVCENPEHMENVIAAFAEHKVGFDRFRLCFTNDYETFRNPDACLYPYAHRKTLADKAIFGICKIMDILVS